MLDEWLEHPAPTLPPYIQAWIWSNIPLLYWLYSQYLQGWRDLKSYHKNEICIPPSVMTSKDMCRARECWENQALSGIAHVLYLMEILSNKPKYGNALKWLNTMNENTCSWWLIQITCKRVRFNNQPEGKLSAQLIQLMPIELWQY